MVSHKTGDIGRNTHYFQIETENRRESGRVIAVYTVFVLHVNRFRFIAPFTQTLVSSGKNFRSRTRFSPKIGPQLPIPTGARASLIHR
jgi:hypothetical protein